MAFLKGSNQYYKWSVQSYPNTFYPHIEPIMVCKDNEEATRIAKAANKGKVVILDMCRKK